MSFRFFCDICKKEVNRSNSPFVGLDIARLKLKHICFDCWADPKNWPKIHSLPQEKEND
jgi:hypothetical protein